MSRPTRPPAKVPNPYEVTTASYFDNTGDGGIRCIAAALSLTGGTHIIICAPDAVELGKAWKQLVPTTPLDIKKAVVCLYKYDTPIEVLRRDQLEEMKEEFKPKMSEIKHIGESTSWSWFMHDESSTCFIEESSFGTVDGNCVQLGEAVKCTVEECKQLLRKNRIPRSLIDDLEINDSTDSLIPF